MDFHLSPRARSDQNIDRWTLFHDYAIFCIVLEVFSLNGSFQTSLKVCIGLELETVRSLVFPQTLYSLTGGGPVLYFNGNLYATIRNLTMIHLLLITAQHLQSGRSQSSASPCPRSLRSTAPLPLIVFNATQVFQFGLNRRQSQQLSLAPLCLAMLLPVATWHWPQ